MVAMIAVVTYHKAEKRGFAPGKELQDCAEAEKEISKRKALEFETPAERFNACVASTD